MKVNIKEVAKKQGVSVIELASRLGVSRQTIHYYCEQGDKNPLAQLEKIADAIGVPVSDLFEKPKDFLAIVRKGGETVTFEDEYSLKKWLCPGLLPIYTMDQMPEVFKEYGKKESSGERGQ